MLQQNRLLKIELLIALTVCALIGVPATSQAQTANGPGATQNKKSQIYVDIQNAAIKRVMVINNKTFSQVASVEVATGEKVVYVPIELEPGDNSFSVNGYDGSSSIPINGAIKIKFNDPGNSSGADQPISILTKTAEVTEPGHKFKILPPTNIPIAATKYAITRTNGADILPSEAPIKRGVDDKAVETELSVTLKEGKNTVTVAAVGAGSNVKATFEIECAKPCKSNGKLDISELKRTSKEAPLTLSSRATRVHIDPPSTLNAGVAKYSVKVENKDAKFTDQREADVYRTGTTVNKSEVLIELRTGLNIVTVSAVAKDAAGDVIEKYEGTGYIRCEDGCDNDTGSQGVNTRAIVGFEQVGASSAPSTTQPFLNFFANVPIINRSKSSKRPISLWTDFRLTASSTQSFASLANISSGFFNPFFAKDSSINNVVRSFSATGGIDFTVIPESKTLQSFFIPGKTSLSIIAGAGITTPLSPRESIQVFKVPKDENGMILPEFQSVFGNDFNDKENIAFVNGDRDRFFRRFFVGGRLKLNPFADKDTRLDQPSGMIDFTAGLDESITRKLSGIVFTLDGFTPIKLGKYDFIYLFAGANLRLTRKINDAAPSLFLEPSTSFNLTDGTTGLFEIGSSDFTRSNRDVFRFGIGVDLTRLFNRPKEQ